MPFDSEAMEQTILDQKIDNLRSSLNYDIDGLVLKVNDFHLQQRLGNTSNVPVPIVFVFVVPVFVATA